MEYFASQAPRFNSFYFDLISDPKSYRDFGETGPWLLAPRFAATGALSLAMDVPKKKRRLLKDHFSLRHHAYNFTKF